MRMHQSQPHVLLADPDVSTRQALRSFFNQAGWQCDLIAENSSVASALNSRNYDLVIAEVESLGGPSYDLLRALRLKRPTQAFIVLARNDVAEECSRSLAGLAVEIVSKPIDLQLLSQSLLRTTRVAEQFQTAMHAVRFIIREEHHFELTARELAGTRFPLLIAEHLERAGILDSKLKLRLDLAFQEVLANALEHGSLGLPSEWKEEIDSNGVDRFTLEKARRLALPEYAARKISVIPRYEKPLLEIRVKDQGEGFIPKEHSVNGSEGGLLSSGRGLTLIRQVMDEVRHEDGGREIVLLKNIQR